MTVLNVQNGRCYYQRGRRGRLSAALSLTGARWCPISWRKSFLDEDTPNMMLRISCPCGHTGLTVAEHLPAELVCSSCASRRCVQADQGRAITSTARFEEWLSGERARPQVQRRAQTLATS